MKKWAQARIEYIMEQYKIHDALLVDVMSWHSIRNDWDREDPASGYNNLVDGKFKIINEFNNRGVNVMSEQSVIPSWVNWLYRQMVQVEVNAPLEVSQFPFWQPSTANQPSGVQALSLEEVQKNLFWNCRPIPWYINVTNRKKIYRLLLHHCAAL